jgi:hypothetical protein
MKCLLDEDDIVRYAPSFYESSLVLWDNGRENALKSVRYEFGKNLIAGVA